MKMSINTKILTAILVLSIVPLLLLGMIAYSGISDFGSMVGANTGELKVKSSEAINKINTLAVQDSSNSLQALAKEAIETRSQDMAKNLASFLYERDADALFARSLSRTETAYAQFLGSKQRDVIYGEIVRKQPLYKEIAFYDLDGNQVLKVTAPGYDGKEYALDDFKTKLSSLRQDELYVSMLWGDYLFKSEAYAGVEKPDGKRYQGYYRWVTPVYENGVKIGYVSLKLDSRHVQEQVVHISPSVRYVKLPDAPSGNYAYLVGADGWLNAHPREYHNKGVLANGQLPPPLDKREGAIPILNDTTPLRFGYLSGHSKELDEIHTVHAVNGDSGSQIYPWAGLTKWIAYATVPYYTGSNYQTKMGFGWVAVGAEISSFSKPANLTAQKINEIAVAQEGDFNQNIDRIQDEVGAETQKLRNLTLTVLVIAILASIIVGLLLASSISKPIKELTAVSKKVSDGNFDVQVPHVKTNDEVSELAASMEMLVAGLKMSKKR